jgi:YggT family protein
MAFLIQGIQFLMAALSWLVIIEVVLSYFMSPYHPLRAAISKVVEPMLSPIRRLIPQTGVFDFSPMVLIIIIQLVGYLLTRFLLVL